MRFCTSPPPVWLQGVVLNSLSTGTTSTLPFSESHSKDVVKLSLQLQLQQLLITSVSDFLNNIQLFICIRRLPQIQ
jgi:hypothetical protein